MENLPRPAPSSVRERATDWVSWFGPGRLAMSALAVVLVCAGAYWLTRAPRPPTEAALPAATAPLAAWVARETWRLEVGDAGFNGTLSAAAALHLLFGSALALGLALDGVAWRD